MKEKSDGEQERKEKSVKARGKTDSKTGRKWETERGGGEWERDGKQRNISCSQNNWKFSTKPKGVSCQPV